MSSIFIITPEDIASLDDVQFRELIGRLSEAEVKKSGFSASTVTWGGDQRAADGGIDVRISLAENQEITGYLPSAQTGIQVKAEDFPVAKIKKEMMPNGALRPAILELAKCNGAYIIVSSKGSVADQPLKNRKKAMLDCLKTEQTATNCIVDFYDRRRIATWVEQYPSIATWVRLKVGRPIEGWQAYAPWAYDEHDIDTEYLIDEDIKIHTPNEKKGMDIHSAINCMRAVLSKCQKSIRLVGLSGVGKTRLVQALFDKKIETKCKALDQDKILYTDLSDHPNPQPLAMVDLLLQRGDECSIIIDNCGSELHEKITEKISHPDSKLNVITVEYDIRDDSPENTVCYRLDTSSNSLIQKLIERRYPKLTYQDINKIVEFSDGNSRVAFALANTVEAGGELSKLNNEALFERLFHQNHEVNLELLKAAEIFSLLYSFEGEKSDPEDKDAELPLFAALSEISVIQLFRSLKELQRRGLVQSRSVWRAVLPHAIANRLAQRALQNLPKDIIINKLVYHCSERVALSFSRRLGYLHDEQRAQEIAREWLKEDGWLGDLGNLRDFGMKLFFNISPIDPEATLQAIVRANKNIDFSSVDNHKKDDFLHILQALAFEEKYFDSAVYIIIDFAKNEPEGNNNGYARDILQSLFYRELSSTNALPKMRINIIQKLLDDEDCVLNELGNMLLNASLETGQFSSSFLYDFGARKQGFGWRPKTYGEINDWYRAHLKMAKKFGLENTQVGKMVRTTIANNFRGLWAYAHIPDELVSLAKGFKEVDGWPQGWRQVKETLYYDPCSEDYKAKLLKIEGLLRPDNLRNKIMTKVISNAHLYLNDEIDIQKDGDGGEVSRNYEKSQDEIRNLGKLAAHDVSVWSQILPVLLTEQKGNIYPFGQSLGQEIKEIELFLARLKSELLMLRLENSKEIRWYFLSAFLNGAQEKHSKTLDSFFDQALTDSIYAENFPYLQASVQLDGQAIERLLRSLELGKASIHQFISIAGGGATEPLNIKEIEKLTLEILKVEDGCNIVFEIVSMVIFSAESNDSKRGKAYIDELKILCQKIIKIADWSKAENMSGHEVEKIINYGISCEGGKETAIFLIRTLKDNYSKHVFSFWKTGKILFPLFELYPAFMLDEIFIADNNRNYLSALRLLARDYAYKKRPLDYAPVDDVIQWCQVEPDIRFEFIIESCSFFTDENEKNLSWKSLPLKILQKSPDKKAILQQFLKHIRPRSWSGSLALIIRNRTKLVEELPKLLTEISADDVQDIVKDLKKMALDEEHREHDRDSRENERFE